jgi:hypothetical protein
MQWSTIDSSILHSYRHAYRLNTPSGFKSSYNHIILSRPGIGKLSPTMARAKDQRRQSKDQLANSVRKHFNGLGIQENEAVVDFLYKVRNQGQCKTVICHASNADTLTRKEIQNAILSSATTLSSMSNSIIQQILSHVDLQDAALKIGWAEHETVQNCRGSFGYSRTGYAPGGVWEYIVIRRRLHVLNLCQTHLIILNKEIVLNNFHHI